MNYKELMKIDPDQLEGQWLSAPGRYMEVVEHAVQARIDCEKAKDCLETIKADMDREIRINPDKYGIGKVTESSISSAIQLCDSVKEAQDEYMETRRIMLLTDGAVNAMEHRKKALDAITQLTLAGWRTGAQKAEQSMPPFNTTRVEKQAHGQVTRRRRD